MCLKKEKIQKHVLIDSMMSLFDPPTQIKSHLRSILNIIVHSSDSSSASWDEFKELFNLYDSEKLNPNFIRALKIAYSKRFDFNKGATDFGDFEQFSRLFDSVHLDRDSSIIKTTFSVLPQSLTKMRTDFAYFYYHLEKKNHRVVMTYLLKENMYELCEKTLCNIVWSLFNVHKTIPDEEIIRTLILLHISRTIDTLLVVENDKRISCFLTSKFRKLKNESFLRILDIVLDQYKKKYVNYSKEETQKLFKDFMTDIKMLPNSRNSTETVIERVIRKICNIYTDTKHENSLISGFKKLVDEVLHINDLISRMGSIDDISFVRIILELVDDNVSNSNSLSSKDNYFLKTTLLPFFFVVTHSYYSIIKKGFDPLERLGILMSQLLNIVDQSKESDFIDEKDISFHFGIFRERAEKHFLFFYYLFKEKRFSVTELIDLIEGDVQEISFCSQQLIKLENSKIFQQITTCHHRLNDLQNKPEEVAKLSKKYSQLIFQASKVCSENDGSNKCIRTISALLEIDENEKEFIIDLIGPSESKKALIRQFVEKCKMSKIQLQEFESHFKQFEYSYRKQREIRKNFVSFYAKSKQKKVNNIAEVLMRLERLGIRLSHEDLLTLFISHHPLGVSCDSIKIEDFISYYQKDLCEEINHKTSEGMSKIAIFQIMMFLIMMKIIDFAFSQDVSGFYFYFKVIMILFLFYSLILVGIYHWIRYHKRRLIQKLIKEHFDSLQLRDF